MRFSILVKYLTIQFFVTIEVKVGLGDTRILYGRALHRTQLFALQYAQMTLSLWWHTLQLGLVPIVACSMFRIACTYPESICMALAAPFPVDLW